MTRKSSVVVFDLDDTLYKEIDFLKSAYRQIAHLVSNGDKREDEVYQVMLDTYLHGGNAFETVIRKYEVESLDVPSMLAIYRNHQPNISLDEDTRSTLEQLKSRGIILGIISDGRRTQQMNKVMALGLNRFVDDENIIINEDRERMKPDERSFRQFMDKYGPDAEFFYVGDNTDKDFIAPNKLGWTSVCLIDNGVNIHKQSFFALEGDRTPIQVSRIGELLEFETFDGTN